MLLCSMQRVAIRIIFDLSFNIFGDFFLDYFMIFIRVRFTDTVTNYSEYIHHVVVTNLQLEFYFLLASAALHGQTHIFPFS